MKMQCMCPCGLDNRTRADWVAHWKYGIPRPNLFLGRWPKVRAIWLFLNTRIEFVK